MRVDECYNPIIWHGGKCVKTDIHWAIAFNDYVLLGLTLTLTLVCFQNKH